MILSKRSIVLVLGLIEDRIGQLDPLIPRDGDDLEALMRCREEMKVTAHDIQEPIIERTPPMERRVVTVSSRRPRT